MEKEISIDNYNTVKEMILDEGRLITYATISKELCIHVNVSKSLLTSIVQDIREKQPDTELNVNYVISGLLEGNKARTTVCSEAETQVIRDSLKLVFFEHVYSVSKGLPKVDNVALMGINKFEDFPLCVGLLKSSCCTKRSSDEVESLKKHSREAPATVKPQKSVSASVIPEKKIKLENKGSKVENTLISKLSDKSKSVKTELCVKKEEVSSKQVTNNKQQNTSKKGIAGFFNKQNGNSAKKPVEKTNDLKELTTKNIEKPVNMIKEEKMEIDEVDVPKETELKNKNTKIEARAKEIKTESKEPNTNGHKNDTVSKKNKGQGKPKSLTQIKKTGKVDKKRKRVLQVSDSDSDGEKDPFADADETPIENHESDDEIPPTPTVNTVKITSGIVNPKKRRKIVDKTYTDEEGYILTKKVEVYESCSENEDDANKKENIQMTKLNVVKKEVKGSPSPKASPKKDKKEAKNSKKKISPPQKGKQATMMNFFKKV